MATQEQLEAGVRDLFTLYVRYMRAEGNSRLQSAIGAAKGSGTNNNTEEPEAGEPDLIKVAQHCNGIARVIVPVIRALYRGPLLAAAAAAD